MAAMSSRSISSGDGAGLVVSDSISAWSCSMSSGCDDAALCCMSAMIELIVSMSTVWIIALVWRAVDGGGHVDTAGAMQPWLPGATANKGEDASP